jgi:uncharacterized protein (TIGR00255 family)
MSFPVRSMTGFARVPKALPQGEVSVTLKSLNHRGLDLHFHTGSELDPFENTLRAVIKRYVFRGHLDVRISVIQAQQTEALGLNETLLRAYLSAFRKAAAEHDLAGAAPDLNVAFRVPGMLSAPPDPELNTELEPALVAALEEALGILNEFRSREGAELAGVIRTHNKAIATVCAQIEQIRGRAMPLFQQRLQERLKELLRNSNIEPQRLAQEAALLADRSDVGEEIARLRIHSHELDEILDNGGEVGKKLDFLLQEMNREANTILSKTNGIGELGLKITALALAAKADIEKIREQSLNLE